MSEWRTCLFNPDACCNADCGCRGDLDGFLARHGHQVGQHGEPDRRQFARLVKLIRRFRASGDIDMAILTAVEIGEMISFYEFGPELDKAWRVDINGYHAAKATWGSPEVREGRREKLRLMFEEERRRSVTNEAAYHAVAKYAGVSPRTVRRAVKNAR